MSLIVAVTLINKMHLQSSQARCGHLTRVGHRTTHFALCRRHGTRSNVIVRAGLSDAKTHDLLACRGLGDQVEYLEVVEGWTEQSQSVTAAWKGQLVRLSASWTGEGAASVLSCERAGDYPPVDGTVALVFPQFREVLPKCYSYADASALRLTNAQVVYSLAQLEADVAADPTPWTAGTKPGAPNRTSMQDAVLAAGMLVALMAGCRGVASVQLWNGWDPARGQPIYAPFTLTLLAKALTTPGLKAWVSAAPGGVGVTGLVAANKEPWSEYAKHLSSFGFQANIVAGSPYYKMLSGLLLGYDPANVKAYVTATSPPGSVDKALVDQVEADIKKLSKAKAKLPWNQEGGSRGKKGAASSAQQPTGAGAGGKGKRR